MPVTRLAAPLDAAPMCPWREPEADMRAFFPGATGYRTETSVLSGARVELTRRLGHPPAPEDHTLYINRVLRGEEPVGAIITRRVRGKYGAIEVVVAAGPEGAVRGIRLQRLREPDAVARALRSQAWLRSFTGKTAPSDWNLEAATARAAPEARASARAVAEGVRSTMILLDTAESLGPDSKPHH